MPRKFFAVILAVLVLSPLHADEPPPAKPLDYSTLSKKVLCGYQGWFRAAGDGTRDGWTHWSRDGRRVAAETLTVEMWPEMSEYGEGEKYAVPGFSYPDGSPAHLFSSANRATVERHFEWMREYGIDGVFLQRFLVQLRQPSLDVVLENVRAAAKKSGRAWAIGYDMSGMRAERLVETLTRDWRQLVDEKKITADPTYLHHNGRPVLFVWGFFSDRFDAATAHKIIDLFHADDKYRVTLIGGCNHPWRSERDAEWARAYRRFDILSPWNVGNYGTENGKRYAATHGWKEDLAETRRAGIGYLPVIYPGFGWTNLQGKQSARQTIPRLGGEFFWRQFVAAGDLGLDMAYVAMFDEVDEATAVFKVSNTPPTQATFQTYEGLPSDWYLRLTGEGTKVIRGEKKAGRELPIRP